ncbi:hypothetical protein ONZ43_g5335 [Nemania bipapillata]|uniref:Uncharacterized protein n=1 Tax=Nemania bipapillata TaxID=110536 RepID=A0ACC2IC28_9PEZI|nr:hypothetical protein ONZ43_g5335 [Nemania bipapillata]
MIPRAAELKNNHEPSPGQCHEVKRILAKASKFPPEIVDIVMDFAEYWVCTMASIDYSGTPNGHFAIHGAREDENTFLLRTEPLGLTTWHPDDQGRWKAAAPARKLNEEYKREELAGFIEGPDSGFKHPFRKVVFDITSKDQGWGGEPGTRRTFQQSWTWFDVGIDRFDKGHMRSFSMAIS